MPEITQFFAQIKESTRQFKKWLSGQPIDLNRLSAYFFQNTSTLLHTVIAQQSAASLRELLHVLRRKRCITQAQNGQNAAGEYPLYIATKIGDQEKFTALIEYGCHTGLPSAEQCQTLLEQNSNNKPAKLLNAYYNAQQQDPSLPSFQQYTMEKNQPITHNDPLVLEIHAIFANYNTNTPTTPSLPPILEQS